MIIIHDLIFPNIDGVGLEYGPETDNGGIDYLYEHKLWGDSWREIDCKRYLIYGIAQYFDGEYHEFENVYALNNTEVGDIYIELHAMGPEDNYVNLNDVPDYELGRFRVISRNKLDDLHGILHLGERVKE